MFLRGNGHFCLFFLTIKDLDFLPPMLNSWCCGTEKPQLMHKHVLNNKKEHFPSHSSHRTNLPKRVTYFSGEKLSSWELLLTVEGAGRLTYKLPETVTPWDPGLLQKCIWEKLICLENPNENYGFTSKSHIKFLHLSIPSSENSKFATGLEGSVWNRVHVIILLLTVPWSLDSTSLRANGNSWT